MSGTPVPLVMVRRIVVAIPWCLATCLLAQTDKPAENRSTTAVEEVRAEEKTTQGSQNSFKLPRSQSVIQCFEIIRQSIERKDYLAAIPLMERVLSEPDSFVPSSTSAEVSTHVEVWRLLESVPAEIRQRFDDSRRIAARRSWEESRTGGMAAVRLFLQQYSDSPWGVDAWWWIGRYEHDHGRFRQAAAAFERSAGHSKATLLQRAMGLLAGMESLLEANRLEDVSPLQSGLSALDGSLVIELGGTSTTLEQALNAPPFNAATKGTVEKFPDRSSTIADWRQLRPVLLPLWKQELTAPFRASLEGLEQRQRDQGIRPIPIVRPMILGQQVLVRTLDEVQSFDLSTGKPRWSVSNTEYRQLGKRALESATLQTVATEWAQRRTEADSIFARMSTDGIRLFVIQEPNRTSELQIDRETPQGLLRRGPRFNRLAAYAIETGNLVWEVGEEPAEKGGALKGVVFLGCPFVLDDLLFVVAQRDTELSLLAMEAETGTLQSSLVLGTAPLPIVDDLQRSRVACPIVWHEGLLLCSTSSGAVVAVDPVLQVLKWGYRYRATTISAGDLARVPGPAGNSLNQEAWWESWREPYASVARLRGLERSSANFRNSPSDSSILVFASPESDQLHAIRLEDGEPLWRVARNGALLVVGTTDDLVIAMEGDSVRAHELRTGRIQWRATTGEISAPAVLSGSIVVLPVRSGGTVLLDARNGQILSESSSTDSPMGVLAETEQGWIAFHRQGLMLLPRLGEVRRRVDLDLANDPNNESLRVRAALLDLQAGEEASARERLTGLTSSPARELRRQALIAALGRQSAANRTDLARELNELADNADYQFAAAAAIGTSALAVDDLVNAVDASLAGLSKNFDPSESLVKRSSVMVRKDRMLLGLIDEAYRRAKPDELAALDGLFAARVKLARKSRDRLALQQLSDLWRGIEWGRRLVVSDEEKAVRNRSFVEIEFRLLDAAGSTDASVAIQALDRLAQRLERLGWIRDARALRERILRDLPVVMLPEGQTESEQIARDPALRESMSRAVKPIWPEIAPEIDPPEKDRNFGVYCPLVPLHIEPGSLAARLDVAVDRTGSEVLFRGETFFHSGEDEEHERKFPLPKTISPYRGPPGFMLREGWGIGRIVVLLVGSELFAISPLDEQGEPNSRVLWSNPIDLQIPFGATKAISNRPGIYDQRHLVVDDSERPIGKVGPVRAGYLCYQAGTKLIAVETETGRDLWRRLDCPADATVLGDDHYVYVWRDEQSLEVLSAIDGRKLEDGHSFASPQTMIHQRDSLVWTASRTAQVQLELHNLKTGQLAWSRSYPEGTCIAVLDTETLCIVTPDGQLNLLEARTAASLGGPLAVNAEGISDIAAWSDAERWYIALSRPVENLSALKALQPNDGYRQKFLNGPLYAVDRHQAKIVWQREFKNEPMGLDQSRVSPVLIQIWKNAPKESREAGKGTLRVIDRRTGKDLLEKSSVDILPYFLLNPDPERAILELKLTQETIRFRYEPDASSEQEDPAK